MNKTTVGKNFRWLREATGLNATQVVAAMKRTSAHVHNIEKGKASIRTEELLALANCFKMSVQSLLVRLLESD